MAKTKRKTPEEVEAIKARRGLYDSHPECTREQQDAYFEKAQEFMDSTYWYTDCKSTARCAIADYLAFRDGLKLIRITNP